MIDPVILLRRIASTGKIDDEAGCWLAGSLRSWWQEGSDPARLPAFLKLPGGSRYEIAVRDSWLRLAAEAIPSEHRAANLKQRMDDFMRQRWPDWRGMSVPPECEAIENALFFAADSGASMRISRRQLSNILNRK